MKMMTRSLIVILAVLIVLAATGDALAKPPRLIYKDSLVHRGKSGSRGRVQKDIAITREGFNKKTKVHMVFFKVKGIKSEQSIGSWEVYDIERHGTPPALSKGKKAYLKGEYGEAIEQLKRLLEATPGSDGDEGGTTARPEWVDAELRYFIGMAYFSTGQYDEARTSLQTVADTYPESRFLASSLFYATQSLVQLNDIDNATQLIDALNDLGEKFGPEWPEKSKLVRADILYAGEKWGSAATEYKSMATDLKSRMHSQPELSELYVEAMRRAGLCYINNSDSSKARLHFQAMTASPIIALKAAGSLGLGEVHLQDGQFRKAVEAFVTVDVIYRSVSSLHVDAFYGAGRAYAGLYLAEKFNEDRNHAQRYAALLRSEGESAKADEIESMVGG